MKRFILNKFSFAVLLLITANVFSQTDKLGTSANFAFFTKIGAFTNEGFSNITGDIGTNAGPLTGFPPGVVNGQIRIETPVTLQSGDDVITAYNYFAGLPCTFPLATNLGGGQLLGPNVYCMGAASTLTGELKLDAQNNPNALFIFQINGAFSVAALSKVVLLNGATFDQIYWQINGAVELGTTSEFQGTIIANGAISLLEGASLFGRALSKAGAIGLKNNFAFIPPPVPLPIKLVKFSASIIGIHNLIEWESEAENNGDYYELEKSIDLKKFSVIANLNTIGKNEHYEFLDKNSAFGTSYYRLKMNEATGKYLYSKIVASYKPQESDLVFAAYPNPVKDILTVKLGLDYAPNQALNVFDASGKNVFLDQTQNRIDMSSLPQGMYILRYFSGGNSRILKIVKQ